MPRRIAMISEHASPLSVIGGVDSGGQNVYVAQLARHLALHGYEVDVFTRRDNPDLPEIVEMHEGVRVIHVTAGPAEFVHKEDMLPYMADFTRFFLSFLRRENLSYDLVHANFWMSGLVAADVKAATGIPFVITFHALGRVRRLHQRDADHFPDERFAVEDRLVAEADAIIAECPQDDADLRRLYNADPARIQVVPCGYDPAEFWPVDKAAARAKLGFAPRERIILQVGRMVPRKGIDTVVHGLAGLVNEHHIPARLVIVGGESDEPDPVATPEIGRLMQVAAEERIEHRVLFAGRKSREELKYYYSAADVFVTLPWYEPFGMTPLESMACGTPVIGSKVGGIKYSVVHGETGYLVPPNDPDRLAEHLAHLFRNPELLTVFSYQSLARVAEYFTWERVARLMADVYEQVSAAGQEALAAEVDGDEAQIIDRSIAGSLRVLAQVRRRMPGDILRAAGILQACFASGGKVLVCGNGGSAADAQHFAGELVGRFKLDGRPGLPVIALTADSAILTAWSNDIGYDSVFARQVEALGRPGDLLIGISTSGRSRNVVNAFTAARRAGLGTIALTGAGGGELARMADLALMAPDDDTPRIQEAHILILHLICEVLESRYLTATSPALALPGVDVAGYNGKGLQG